MISKNVIEFFGKVKKGGKKPWETMCQVCWTVEWLCKKVYKFCF